ncbi:hypothetical protein ISF_02860 [Cordyceps fumosorosea ARSEF 2679]|uniref:Uncharacterized protein n=1 Tax=Cordyceps fumosorosea (strain ARSEF 2679) TaxID=1081104 RepID=A0A168B405_CORFA|nr:hypothetical protein ISF_02860 [Cordyceps fumosorosea ARSEF 2679]OAA69590.1 hypothetical protein ISF_02860 [Cordyceps fumosorosea ARSEF 2679]
MSPSNSIRAAHLPRDTGFPEPFCSGRNTTLPHPEADLSPNACIGQEDVHVDFTRKRTGLSFLHRSKKHRKGTLVHGALAASQSSAGQSAVSLVSSTAPGGGGGDSRPQTRERSSSSSHRQPLRRPHSNSQPSIVETPPSPMGSKYARDSFATTRRDEEETPPTSPDDASVKSKRRLLNKFRRR